MKKLSLLLILAASPAFAAGDEAFFTLRSTEFVVTIGFLIFVAAVLKFRIPARLGALLDKRSEGIKSDLAEARALREEAQAILAGYERKAREVQSQAEAIVTAAKRDAQVAAEQAKADLEASIARRLKSAEEQLASAEAQALRAIKDRAVQVAVAAAGEVLSQQATAETKAGMVDAAIGEVRTRLN